MVVVFETYHRQNKYFQGTFWKVVVGEAALRVVRGHGVEHMLS